MGGKSSLDKGKRGEREILVLLQAEVTKFCSHNGLPDRKMKRNTLQSDSGGYDLLGVPWLAAEVKYQETWNFKAYWDQTTRQARPDQVPVLFYRKSRVKWRVRMVAHLPLGPDCGQAIVADMSIEAFLAWFRKALPYYEKEFGSSLLEEGC